jgi:hypothetical protein
MQHWNVDNTHLIHLGIPKYKIPLKSLSTPVERQEWLEQLEDKCWFDIECRTDFLMKLKEIFWKPNGVN